MNCGINCKECGAAVGHRMITVEPGAYRVCSLGMDTVPRASYEKLCKDLDDTNASWETAVAAYIKACEDRDSLAERVMVLEDRLERIGHIADGEIT